MNKAKFIILFTSSAWAIKHAPIITPPQFTNSLPAKAVSCMANLAAGLMSDESKDKWLALASCGLYVGMHIFMNANCFMLILLWNVSMLILDSYRLYHDPRPLNWATKAGDLVGTVLIALSQKGTFQTFTTKQAPFVLGLLFFDIVLQLIASFSSEVPPEKVAAVEPAPPSVTYRIPPPVNGGGAGPNGGAGSNGGAGGGAGTTGGPGPNGGAGLSDAEKIATAQAAAQTAATQAQTAATVATNAANNASESADLDVRAAANAKSAAAQAAADKANAAAQIAKNASTVDAAIAAQEEAKAALVEARTHAGDNPTPNALALLPNAADQAAANAAAAQAAAAQALEAATKAKTDREEAAKVEEKAAKEVATILTGSNAYLISLSEFWKTVAKDYATSIGNEELQKHITQILNNEYSNTGLLDLKQEANTFTRNLMEFIMNIFKEVQSTDHNAILITAKTEDCINYATKDYVKSAEAMKKIVEKCDTIIGYFIDRFIQAVAIGYNGEDWTKIEQLIKTDANAVNSASLKTFIPKPFNLEDVDDTLLPSMQKLIKAQENSDDIRNLATFCFKFATAKAWAGAAIELILIPIHYQAVVSTENIIKQNNDFIQATNTLVTNDPNATITLTDVAAQAEDNLEKAKNMDINAFLEARELDPLHPIKAQQPELVKQLAMQDLKEDTSEAFKAVSDSNDKLLIMVYKIQQAMNITDSDILIHTAWPYNNTQGYLTPTITTRSNQTKLIEAAIYKYISKHTFEDIITFQATLAALHKLSSEHRIVYAFEVINVARKHIQLTTYTDADKKQAKQQLDIDDFISEGSWHNLIEINKRLWIRTKSHQSKLDSYNTYRLLKADKKTYYAPGATQSPVCREKIIKEIIDGDYILTVHKSSELELSNYPLYEEIENTETGGVELKDITPNTGPAPAGAAASKEPAEKKPIRLTYNQDAKAWIDTKGWIWEDINHPKDTKKFSYEHASLEVLKTLGITLSGKKYFYGAELKPTDTCWEMQISEHCLSLSVDQDSNNLKVFYGKSNSIEAVMDQTKTADNITLENSLIRIILTKPNQATATHTRGAVASKEEIIMAHQQLPETTLPGWNKVEDSFVLAFEKGTKGSIKVENGARITVTIESKPPKPAITISGITTLNAVNVVTNPAQINDKYRIDIIKKEIIQISPMAWVGKTINQAKDWEEIKYDSKRLGWKGDGFAVLQKRLWISSDNKDYFSHPDITWDEVANNCNLGTKTITFADITFDQLQELFIQKEKVDWYHLQLPDGSSSISAPQIKHLGRGTFKDAEARIKAIEVPCAYHYTSDGWIRDSGNALNIDTLELSPCSNTADLIPPTTIEKTLNDAVFFYDFKEAILVLDAGISKTKITNTTTYWLYPCEAKDNAFDTFYEALKSERPYLFDPNLGVYCQVAPPQEVVHFGESNKEFVPQFKDLRFDLQARTESEVEGESEEKKCQFLELCNNFLDKDRKKTVPQSVMGKMLLYLLENRPVTMKLSYNSAGSIEITYTVVIDQKQFIINPKGWINYEPTDASIPKEQWVYSESSTGKKELLCLDAILNRPDQLPFFNEFFDSLDSMGSHTVYTLQKEGGLPQAPNVSTDQKLLDESLAEEAKKYCKHYGHEIEVTNVNSSKNTVTFKLPGYNMPSLVYYVEEKKCRINLQDTAQKPTQNLTVYLSFKKKKEANSNSKEANSNSFILTVVIEQGEGQKRTITNFHWHKGDQWLSRTELASFFLRQPPTGPYLDALTVK